MSPRISNININTLEFWDSLWSHSSNSWTQFPNEVIRYEIAANMQTGDSALEIGCGQGGLALALLQLHPEVRYLGTDFSAQAIQTAICKRDYLVKSWDEVTERADTVYALEVIEHLNDPNAFIKHLAGLANKRLVISTPRYKVHGFDKHHGAHMWDFTDDEIVDMLKIYGKVGERIPAGTDCQVVAVDL